MSAIRLSRRGMKWVLAGMLASGLSGWTPTGFEQSALAAPPPRATALGDARQAVAQAWEEIRGYSMDVFVLAPYRKWTIDNIAPKLKTHLEKLDDLGKVSPADKTVMRPVRVRTLALLAFLDQEEGVKGLEAAASSTVPADALVGKVGQLMVKWWKDQKAESQAKIIEEFRALAKANAADEMLVSPILDLGKMGSADLKTANSLRDIIETDLKSQAAAKYKARPDKLGRPLAIAGTTVQGKPFTTAQWKGKVVIADFWATWCGPCREALPEVIKLYEENHDKGLEIVGVSCDSVKPALVQFMGENKGMAWPQLYGPAGQGKWHALAEKYEIRSVPTMYLIDRNGVLRAMGQGKHLEEMAVKLLAEPVDAIPATPAAKATAGK